MKWLDIYKRFGALEFIKIVGTPFEKDLTGHEQARLKMVRKRLSLSFCMKERVLQIGADPSSVVGVEPDCLIDITFRTNDISVIFCDLIYFDWSDKIDIVTNRQTRSKKPLIDDYVFTGSSLHRRMFADFGTKLSTSFKDVSDVHDAFGILVYENGLCCEFSDW